MNQYSHGEIMSMYGIEIDDPEYLNRDDDEDFDEDEESEVEQEDDYPCSCGGRGCNTCLMLSY